MRKILRQTMLLVGTCSLASLFLHGQAPRRSVDIGVTYDAERAYIAPGQCNCFWFHGGGVDAAVGLWRGLGIAGSFAGDHASNVQPGVDLSKISYLVGPRYTYKPWKTSSSAGLGGRVEVFGEGLFGGTHGFHSAFPSTSGLMSSANSFAMQIGGGAHLLLSKRLAIRVIEADYARTTLPNNSSNVQNDLRLGAGLVLHVGSRH